MLKNEGYGFQEKQQNQIFDMVSDAKVFYNYKCVAVKHIYFAIPGPKIIIITWLLSL